MLVAIKLNAGGTETKLGMRIGIHVGNKNKIYTQYIYNKPETICIF